ncbi:MAG: M14 family zinc carboxypeptidase, partial [Candidatus Syntrophosphaera sp.]
VDLNRNYGYRWGYTSATDDMMEATYHGPEPFSEPETQILRDLILSRRFLAGIGYHTYGELVLYPYGYVNGIVAPDGEELEALANEMAALLPTMSGSGNYAPGPSWGLYPVSGSLDDWSYGETGTFSYTIEMADEFIPPYAAVPTIVQHQVNAALALMQRKDKKILRGHVTDAATGDPLEARIYIEEFDNHALFRAPVRSDSLFGDYYYLLPAGQYTVSYICPGYETEERTVLINPSAPTIEEVCLTPSQPYELNIQVQGDYFEPLSGATLVIEEMPDAVYTSGPQGNITIWDFYPGTYQMTVSKPGYETLNIMRHISSGSITLRIMSQPMILEDFEMSLANWTPTGSWGRSDAEAYSGSYSLADSPTSNYQNNSNSTCRLTNPLNLMNVENVNLRFMLKTSLALDGDNLILECSSDGNSWDVIDCYEGSVDWAERSYNLNSYAGQDLYIRFRLYTGNWGSSDGVYIDDFKLFSNSDASETGDIAIPPAQLNVSASPNPFSTSSNIQIKTLTGLENAAIRIFNLRGQLVKTLLATNKLTKGAHDLVWDGRDEQGSETANGIYFLRVSDASGALASIKIARIK